MKQKTNQSNPPQLNCLKETVGLSFTLKSINTILLYKSEALAETLIMLLFLH